MFVINVELECGGKMFNAILQGMNDADKKGDLCLEHEIPENQK